MERGSHCISYSHRNAGSRKTKSQSGMGCSRLSGFHHHPNDSHQSVQESKKEKIESV